MTSPSRQSEGAAAEAAAAAHLEQHGLRVIARNVRFRGGEIDLICQDGPAVVFVEVRLRKNPRFGGAAESITATKRARVVSAAQHWLLGAGARHANAPCRFDAVLLASLAPLQLEWIRNAFTAD